MRKFLTSLLVGIVVLVGAATAKADSCSGYVYVTENGQSEPLHYVLTTVTVKAYYNGAVQPGWTTTGSAETDVFGQYDITYNTPPDTAHITKMSWTVTAVQLYTIEQPGTAGSNSYRGTASLLTTQVVP